MIKPHPFFPTIVERSLIEHGRQEQRQVVYYMPGNFSAMPGILAQIGIDAFIMQVAPMDKAGFFSCGTNGDYTDSDRALREASDRRGQPADATRIWRFGRSYCGC